MDKKKFYIILLSIVIIAVVGYAIIFLIGGSFTGSSAPSNNNTTSSDQEELKDFSPQIKIISGDVISVENGIIQIESTLKGESKVIELKSEKLDVDKVYGSYNEQGGLVEEDRRRVSLDMIKEGDFVSAIISETVSFDDVDKDIINVDDIIIDPPGNPENNKQ